MVVKYPSEQSTRESPRPSMTSAGKWSSPKTAGQWWRQSLFMGLGTLSVVLLLWQWGAQRYTSVILPSPMEVAIAFRSLFQEGLVVGAIAATTSHVFVGFALALVIGGLLGLAVGQQPWLRPAIAPIAVALLGTPPIAWLVLTMVWFGLTSTNSIFTVAVTVAPIIFAGVADAVMTLDSGLLAVAQVYRLRGRSRFQCLYWPHLVSRLLPVCVTGLGIGWRVSIMSEVLATPVGIGAEMNTARANLDTASVMAWIVITIVLVLTSDTLLRLLQWRLLPWRHHIPRGVAVRHPPTHQMGAAP